MTRPGIYAEESSERGGLIMRIKYPWDEDLTTKLDYIQQNEDFCQQNTLKFPDNCVIMKLP